MNKVSETLFIPLYGKAQVSRQGIILHDPVAEKIWSAEAFPIKGKSKSKWLSYNMAMRARVFDDWTDSVLREEPDAVVLHLGCGLDSRCLRVKENYSKWFDCDLPEVIAVREKYFTASANCTMLGIDARTTDFIGSLPDAECAVVVMEGLSMYLTNAQLREVFEALNKKYARVIALMDVYTAFAAKASKYKNPVNDVGVTTLYGVDDLSELMSGTGFTVDRELSFTPEHLVNELGNSDRRVFKLLFGGKLYGKLYRLFELSSCVGK